MVVELHGAASRPRPRPTRPSRVRFATAHHSAACVLGPRRPPQTAATPDHTFRTAISLAQRAFHYVWEIRSNHVEVITSVFHTHDRG